MLVFLKRYDRIEREILKLQLCLGKSVTWIED